MCRFGRLLESLKHSESAAAEVPVRCGALGVRSAEKGGE